MFLECQLYGDKDFYLQYLEECPTHSRCLIIDFQVNDKKVNRVA